MVWLDYIRPRLPHVQFRVVKEVIQTLVARRFWSPSQLIEMEIEDLVQSEWPGVSDEVWEVLKKHLVSEHGAEELPGVPPARDLERQLQGVLDDITTT